jgi:hypothetical protein
MLTGWRKYMRDLDKAEIGHVYGAGYGHLKAKIKKIKKIKGGKGSNSKGSNSKGSNSKGSNSKGSVSKGHH